MVADLIESVVKILFIFSVNIGFFSPILGWVERKQSALMQDRVGANRADVFGFTLIGLFHPIADAIKVLTKEDFVPDRRGQAVSYPCAVYQPDARDHRLCRHPFRRAI